MDRRHTGGEAGGTPLRRYLAALRRDERGASVAALFDFDGTLVAGYSVFAFLQEKLRRGRMSALEATETAQAVLRYALGTLDFEGLLAVGARHARAVPERSYRELGEALFERRLAGRVFAEARTLIAAHRSLGHTLAIVTSATAYQVAPAARALGIEHVLCSRFKVHGGVFTGGLVTPVCHGEGKLQAARALARRHDLDLARSYFYSDSQDDLPLLAAVGRPRLVNPSASLAALGRRHGWTTLRFRARRTPGPLDYLRGLTPYPTLAAAILAGLPVLALTGSARRTSNFVLGTFGDWASALTGVTLDVRGARHLARARPCVVVFNHQSNADVFIVAKLVRRDMTGIGKRELRSVPVLGRVMELGGMVFVDRRHTTSAIEAMAPLVDAIRRDRKTVCIAPEGTRSPDGRLGPFRKGAFHLAMQAGVPVLPVVIHNSRDVQPKHSLAMQPAVVRVEVLSPIDTSNWRVRTLERHVRDVRQRFLDRLGPA